MSQPARCLRQPKLPDPTKKMTTVAKEIHSPVPQVIVTLKCDKKLVLPSDSYHGIIAAGDVFKCILCDVQLIMNVKLKETHKISPSHMEFLKNYPHSDEYSENLLRKLKNDKFYCTICNSVITASYLRLHISSETHTSELNKALSRASIYKPCN